MLLKVIGEEERIQLKLYEKQQADMEKLSTFVRVNKANGVANSAKSKKKVLEKVTRLHSAASLVLMPAAGAR